MSWIACDLCGQQVNSDDDPQCFAETGGAYGEWEVLCEKCREEQKVGEFEYD